MTTAQWVFEQAMHLMDEGSESTGAADNAETRTYKHRTLPILNVLRVECFPYSDTCIDQAGKRPICPEIIDMNSEIGLDDAICQGVLPYGLAAHLLLDENPALADFFRQRYEAALEGIKRSLPAVEEDIADLYGGVECGRFARW